MVILEVVSRISKRVVKLWNRDIAVSIPGGFGNLTVEDGPEHPGVTDWALTGGLGQDGLQRWLNNPGG